MLVVNRSIISLIFLFYFRCAPGYQGNPLLPNGKCVPNREYTFLKGMKSTEAAPGLFYLLYSSVIQRYDHEEVSTLCNDYHQVFSPGITYSRLCGHVSGMQSGWNTPRCTFLPLCHLLSIALSLQKTPSVITEEPSTPAAGHAAARYTCSMVKCKVKYWDYIVNIYC